MMRPARFTATALCLLAGLSGTAVAQGPRLPAPGIRAAHRFQFTPQPGTAWMIEGTQDGATWQDVAGPFFATGKPAEHFRPAGAERLFRLRYVDPAATGPAPVSAAGYTLTMEHQGRAQEIIFLDAASGILRIDEDHARTFTCSWTKTAADRVEIILAGTDGTFTLVRLEFLAAGLGRWGMEDIPAPAAAELVKQPVDSGSFFLTSGRTAYGAANARLPHDLNARSIVLNEAGRLSVLEFDGPGNVSLHQPGQPVQQGGYTYDPESDSTGKLAIHLPGMPAGGFDITLNTHATGVLQQSSGGQPPRTGTFSLPGKPAPSSQVNCPPTDIAGRAYIFADSAPCTLIFYPNGEGIQKKEIAGVTRVTHFRYLYSRTGGNKAGVALSYPGAAGDLVDDYELDFKDDCSGEFKRSSYAGGQKAGQRSSSFAPAPAAQ